MSEWTLADRRVRAVKFGVQRFPNVGEGRSLAAVTNNHEKQLKDFVYLILESAREMLKDYRENLKRKDLPEFAALVGVALERRFVRTPDA